MRNQGVGAERIQRGQAQPALGRAREEAAGPKAQGSRMCTGSALRSQPPSSAPGPTFSLACDVLPSALWGLGDKG